jgi:hypothetical protein
MLVGYLDRQEFRQAIEYANQIGKDVACCFTAAELRAKKEQGAVDFRPWMDAV